MITEILILVVALLGFLQYYTQRRPSKFPPGPIGIPGLGYLPFIRVPIHIGLIDLKEKYGNIFSVFVGNFPVVVLNDWNTVREAFRDERFSGRPPLALFEDRSFGKQRGIVFSTERPWLEQRRFVVKNLRDFGYGKGSMEDLIKDEVVDIISAFRKELNRPLDLQARFNMAVLNSLWHIISGERYAHDDPKMSRILKILSEEFDNVQPGGPLFFLPWLTKIFPGLTGLTQFLNALELTYSFLGESVDAHKKSFDGNNPRDLIDVFLKEIKTTTDPTSSFYKEEGEKQLLVVLLDLFAAGADTTSTSLNWLILYLITYPHVQQKLYTEIESVVGTGRLPALADRPRMPYLEAVIAESMRMSSITPLGLRSATEPLEFHGYTIPKHTMIFANFWHLHHDKDYWGDPENFRPERFIDAGGSFKKMEGLFPFSVGKRACPGESLARDSMFLFLTGLLQQFSFEVDPNAPHPSLEARIALITKTKPFNVIIKERNGRAN